MKKTLAQKRQQHALKVKLVEEQKITPEQHADYVKQLQEMKAKTNQLKEKNFERKETINLLKTQIETEKAGIEQSLTSIQRSSVLKDDPHKQEEIAEALSLL